MKKGSESTKTAIKFFRQFLVGNDALGGYLAGLAAVKATPGLNFNIKRKVDVPYEFIADAFGWHNTEEGHKYWYNLDQQWVKVCDALNLRY